jgi:phenylacetate-coenzyme A ligase PaaK-like adenylate-forming protein
MIYFYPTSDVSITTRNVVASVEACHLPLEPLDGIDTSVEERMERFRVTAFLSVPYILSVLAEDINGTGIEMLQSMRFVSTGGAPLDTAIGDAMVKTGVRLVSRLGSSECGCEYTFKMLGTNANC